MTLSWSPPALCCSAGCGRNVNSWDLGLPQMHRDADILPSFPKHPALGCEFSTVLGHAVCAVDQEKLLRKTIRYENC